MSPTPDETRPAPALEILPGQLSGRLCFADLFGRRAAVEIEVGIGKGRFLLQQAELRPEVDFLGLEWSLKHLRVAKERAERRRLTNVRLYRADARHVIADLVPDASVARLHVYCPDPWPKKRHRKRRFFTPEMAPHLERILVPGGHLELSTDVLEYFEAIRTVLVERSGLEAADPLVSPAGASGNTNYEVKYLMAGRAIHRATYVRPAARAGARGAAPVSRSPR
jgi:tRNA (guanine-N7-)-methyltransferase